MPPVVLRAINTTLLVAAGSVTVIWLRVPTPRPVEPNVRSRSAVFAVCELASMQMLPVADVTVELPLSWKPKFDKPLPAATPVMVMLPLLVATEARCSIQMPRPLFTPALPVPLTSMAPTPVATALELLLMTTPEFKSAVPRPRPTMT